MCPQNLISSLSALGHRLKGSKLALAGHSPDVDLGFQQLRKCVVSIHVRSQTLELGQEVEGVKNYIPIQCIHTQHTLLK